MKKKDKQKITQSILESMVAMATCDGEYHKNEKVLIEKYAKDKGLNLAKNPRILQVDEAQKVVAGTIKDIKSLEKPREQETFLWMLLEQLHSVASADNVLIENEQQILATIHEECGIKTSFAKRKDLVWNDEQKAVMDCPIDTRLIVSAPPGSGKTELVANKVIQFVDDGISAQEMLLISFTRNAIAEMRDRIANRAKNYPHGIKILTLDSFAYRINKAYQDGFQINKGDYAFSLVEFKKLLSEEDEEFLSWVRGLKHVFIDEAQDVVNTAKDGGKQEPRKDICLELTEKLSKECGVSIFGDEAQQVYGSGLFGAKKETSLLGIVSKSRKDNGFERQELESIHRTNDKQLIRLIRDMRLQILAYDDALDKGVENPMASVAEQKLEEVLEESTDNYLFLFSYNKELIQSANNIHEAGKRFRLNPVVGKFENYYPLWLNELIVFCEKKGIDSLSFSSFKQFYATRLHFINIQMDHKEMVWIRILGFLGVNEEVPIKKFRKSLAEVKKMPVAFCNRFHGGRGPVLSTVHSAKGSQARHVVLGSGNLMEKSKSVEEAKLVFVAFSRAQKSMPSAISITGRPFKREKYIQKNWKKKERHYQAMRLDRNKNPERDVKMEIGLSGDYDPVSIVMKNQATLPQVEKSQKILKDIASGTFEYECFAEKDRNAFEYTIKVLVNGDKFFLGHLTDEVHNCFVRRIESNYYAWKVAKLPWEPPLKLEDLIILDVATHMASEEDLEKDIHQKYRRRGSWIYPVIYGLGPFEFSTNQ